MSDRHWWIQCYLFVHPLVGRVVYGFGGAVVGLSMFARQFQHDSSEHVTGPSTGVSLLVLAAMSATVGAFGFYSVVTRRMAGVEGRLDGESASSADGERGGVMAWPRAAGQSDDEIDNVVDAEE